MCHTLKTCFSYLIINQTLIWDGQHILRKSSSPDPLHRLNRKLKHSSNLNKFNVLKIRKSLLLIYVWHWLKNKTNHPISSNSHPSATAKLAIFSLKIGGGVTKPTGTSYNFGKVWSGAPEIRNLFVVVFFFVCFLIFLLFTSYFLESIVFLNCVWL